MTSRCLVAFLLGLVLSRTHAAESANAVSAPDPGPAIPLLLGSPAERALSGGAHIYALRLKAGQFVRIVAVQSGLDLALTLRGPGGIVVAEVDDPTIGVDGEERLVATVPTSGEHLLEVKANRVLKPGQYVLTLEELRDAQPFDCDRVEAQQRLVEGSRLCEQDVAVSVRQGALAFARALELCRRFADHACEARALSGLGMSRLFLGDPGPAAGLYLEALLACEGLGSPYLEAEALSGLATAHDQLGHKGTALEYYEESLPFWRASGRRSGTGTIVHDIALVQDNLGEKRAAATRYAEALALLREAGDRATEAATLNGLGKAADELGDYQRALDAYEDAYKLATEFGNVRGQAVILTNIGLVYSRLGAPERALRYCEQALPLRKKVGDPRGEATTLTAMGKALFDLGRVPEAIDLYEKALALSRGANDPRGEAIALTRLATAYEGMGRNEEALASHLQSAELRRRTGEVLAESASLTRVGALQLRKGDAAAARESFARSLELARASGDRGQEAEDLAWMAELARQDGRLEEAKSLLEQSIRLTDEVRRTVASPELRASYAASVRRARELLVDTLLALHRRDPAGGHAARAFEVVDQGRARSLFEVLTAPDAATPAHVDPALFEQRRDLRERLASKLDRRLRLAPGKTAAADLAEATAEIDRLEADLDRLDARIRAGSPAYAALSGAQATTLQALQENLLDDHSVLLEYALGPERSFVWAVTRSSVSVHELGKRSDVEEAARLAYARLSARQSATDALARVARLVLDPVSAELRQRRLLVVADGALQYLPFSALPSPSTGGRVLLTGHEVVSLPSASVLGALRGDSFAGRRPARTVAVFADPVFDARDPRVTGSVDAAEGASAPTLSLARSVSDLGLASGGGLRLPRLPFTRREAERIVALVPPSEGRQALDFAASRAAVVAPDLADFRFVHFATHGLLDDRNPELSGLVLSLVDRAGKEQPGFLPASDVVALKLSADVVALSGCQTALGKDVKGEGLVGLTRAFMYAGARSVVSTLWKVDDAATAELMSRFYAGMLGHKRLSPAGALRAAQMSLREDSRWRSPYYWAAFVLHGE